ncbi:MAG TPA: BamA/TamA family outer membrane protein [Bacteroidales bacterium]|nr:BamA/TamA family outer membrane protein [Bacteroidales bacterium]
MRRIRVWIFFSLTVSAMILFSCNPTKYVPEGETLLDENKIKVSNEGIKPVDLEPYLKQKPNKKIFGARFHLGLYNLSNIEKDKGIHKWLREIGEEPVIFDPYAAIKSVGQIKSYISSKGYFDGIVDEDIETSKNKSAVYYKVAITKPYKIRNITYEISDFNLLSLFIFDSLNSVIERGKPYDVDVMQKERLRFERLVRDHGFYEFSSDYISFEVDSTVGNRQVDINYVVRNYPRTDENNIVRLVPHSIFRINNIYIYPEFVPRDALEEGEAYFRNLDTIFYRGYYFIGKEKIPEVKYDFIIQSLYLKSGATYNMTNTEQSRAHLLGSKVYRLVNISFSEFTGNDEPTGYSRKIDCIIQLTLLGKQSYKVELEGTNSGGNLGGALNLIYQNKNLFHGAELFSMKLKGAYEAMRQEGKRLDPTQEYGVETSLRLPDFLIPFFKSEEFVKKYNPTTTIIAAYNYQNMPFYKRKLANTAFGYNWKAGNYKEHFVNPLQFNLVKLDTIDPEFARQVNTSSYLAYAYQDALILGGSYSYVFNNQTIKKSRDYWFLRWNIESAGNLLSAFNNISNPEQPDSVAYKFLGQPFAQYVRTDFDLRYNYVMNEASSMVYRGFFGIGIPYGNSKAIPFEKQYFGGGANGVRGWQVRTLGPGSYVPDTTFLNQTADLKLELNTEYRFKLFWILEGAVFVDAGNIWNYREDPGRPGSQFKLNTFYKDIAIGTGAGLRFDFSFFLGRIDFGMKLRDPVIQERNKWIISQRPYERNDFTVVIAIGYPF